MNIICNGQQRSIASGATLEELLSALQLEPDSVVAEINKKIIDREHYADLLLQNGDLVELIRFVGGG